ncbi:hypothetical protein BH20ACT8_BH20ACT8_00190 [soil metagenome]
MARSERLGCGLAGRRRLVVPGQLRLGIHAGIVPHGRAVVTRHLSRVRAKPFMKRRWRARKTTSGGIEASTAPSISGP